MSAAILFICGLLTGAAFVGLVWSISARGRHRRSKRKLERETRRILERSRLAHWSEEERHGKAH